MLRSRLGSARGLFKKAMTNGFAEILIGGTAAKAISFVSVVVLSRLITKSSFGILSYADNIRNYILLFSGLGLQNSVLRYTSVAENSKDKAAVFKTSLLAGSAFNLALAAAAALVFRFYQLPVQGASELMVQMCLLPSLMYVFDCSQLYLRADFRNRDFAKLSVLYSLAFMAFQMVFAFFGGIKGVVAGRYLSFIIVIAACVYFVPALRAIRQAPFLRSGKAKEILRYGLLAMLASCASLMIPLNELLIVGGILKNNGYIAEYKAASIIPQILGFITTAVVTFVFPYFSRNFQNKKWVWRSYQKVIALLCGMLLPVFVFLFLFPGFFLSLIYGRAYCSGGGILRALLIANAVNICVRNPTGNLLAALGDVRFNFYNALACAAVHLVTGILLVSSMGIIGSPVSLVIVYTLSSLTEVVYFRRRYGRPVLSKQNAGYLLMRKRLLFVAHVPLRESEKQRHSKFFSQMDALRGLGMQVDYIGNDGESYYLCRGAERIFLTRSPNTGLMGRLRFFSAGKKLLGLSKNYDYAYVRGEPFIPPFLGLLKKLKKQGTRVILELPTYPYDRERLISRKGILPYLLLPVDQICRRRLRSRVDLIAAFCEEKRIFGVPVVTVCNAADLAHIRPRKAAFHQKELHLLALAKMDLWHGYDRLIEGMRLYYAQNPEFKVFLHLAGSGDCLTDWFGLVQKYRLGSYVVFHGECYGRELDELFDQCDLGVTALAVYRKGLDCASTLKVSEYCARGLPFLYGCRELGIEDGVPFAMRLPNNGEPVDIAEVAAFYRGILAAPGISNRMISYAQWHFSWALQFKKILNRLEQLTEDPQHENS